jgi:hypothetical protein
MADIAAKLASDFIDAQGWCCILITACDASRQCIVTVDGVDAREEPGVRLWLARQQADKMLATFFSRHQEARRRPRGDGLVVNSPVTVTVASVRHVASSTSTGGDRPPTECQRFREAMWPPAGERRRHDPRVGKRLRTDWPSSGAAVATGHRLRSIPDRRGDYQRERCRLLPGDDAGWDHSPDQLNDDDRGRQSDEDRGESPIAKKDRRWRSLCARIYSASNRAGHDCPKHPFPLSRNCMKRMACTFD